MNASAADLPWDIAREVVLTRVFDAPRDLVFAAWTKNEHLPRWFGPKGYSCATHEIDVRVGGRWRFTMHGPDGATYPSRMVFLEITAPERLVFDHGGDADDDPSTFRVIVTFEEQADKKTVLTMRQLLPTLEQRKAVIAFGAVELGYQTLDKLAAQVAELQRA